MISSPLGNVWFLRFLILVSGMIVAALLLAYDLIFLDTEFVYLNTTSYFPWAWGVNYTDYGTISNMFFGAEALSVCAIAGCILYFINFKPQFASSLRAARRFSFSRYPALRNNWLLLSIAIFSGIVASTVLFAYSFIFYRTFAVHGSAVSYLPWAWDQLYTDPSSVQNLIFQGAAIWIIDVSVSALLLYVSIPKAITHLRARREMDEISAREAACFGFGLPNTHSIEPKEGIQLEEFNG